MDAKSRAAVDRRLARVEGQIRGLRRMLAEESYCVDIVTQLTAVRSALDQIGAELVVGHVQSCVLGHGTPSEHACAEPMSHEELLDELRTTLSRLMR
jgi:DNA-binding FrmR family transcriptional regulator